MARRAPDVTDWIEPVPPWAGPAWVLPATGGRVIIRGYDEVRIAVHDAGMRSSWALDEALVPVVGGSSEDTYGPGGVVYPGDCIVYLAWDGRPRPRAWAPARVVAVGPGPRGWQRVWSVCDTSDSWALERHLMHSEPHPVVPASAIPTRLRTEAALHGDGRRLVLEIFGLNLECPQCGGRGMPIWYDVLMNPTPPHVILRDRPRRPGDPTYGCGCGAAWSVGPRGELALQEPHPVL